MNRILIEAVEAEMMRPPYNAQEEGGDWFVNGAGELVIRVIGENLDKPEAFLFALHELVEAALCRKDGVSQEAVDRFDLAYEGMEDRGPDDEPGDHPASPYRKQHRRAMLIEHMMAWFMGITNYGTVA